MEKRYILTTEYPGSHFSAGTIFTVTVNNMVWVLTAQILDMKPANYPDVFKEIPWWYKVPLEEMPLYVRVVSGSNYYTVGDILKVLDWNTHSESEHKRLIEIGKVLAKTTSRWFANVSAPHHPGKGHCFNASDLEPATEKECKAFWNIK